MRRNPLRTACAVLIGSAALMSLSACTPSAADERYGGLPHGVELDVPPLATDILAVAYNGSLAIVTWGGSTCLPTAVEFAVSEDQAEIVFAPSRQQACTADLGPTTHVFGPETVGETVPETASITFEESGDTHVVEVLQY